MRALAVAAVLAGGVAHADVRSFTRTWEYSSVPEGRTTIDLWHTQGQDAFAQVLEIEHGVTDALDVALFTTFGEDGAAAASFGLRETRLTGRYRFVERAEWPVDTMVHVSAAKVFGANHYLFLGRLVGARDLDRLLLAGNASVEVGAGSGDTEVRFAGAVGASYQLHRTLRLGAEGSGTFADAHRPIVVGPVANWSPTSTFWVTVGAAFGVTDEAERVEVRGIVGIEL